MSNSFPPVPTDLQLQNITYMLNFGGNSPVTGPSLTFSGVTTGMYGAIVGLGSEGGIEFTFNTPGTFGGFDQTSAETEIKTIVGGIFQLMSDITGVPVTTLETNFSISRRWTWTDAGGNQATYTDRLVYP